MQNNPNVALAVPDEGSPSLQAYFKPHIAPDNIEQVFRLKQAQPLSQVAGGVTVAQLQHLLGRSRFLCCSGEGGLKGAACRPLRALATRSPSHLDAMGAAR
jgi:hypothetical protein